MSGLLASLIARSLGPAGDAALRPRPRNRFEPEGMAAAPERAPAEVRASDFGAPPPPKRDAPEGRPHAQPMRAEAIAPRRAEQDHVEAPDGATPTPPRAALASVKQTPVEAAREAVAPIPSARAISPRRADAESAAARGDQTGPTEAGAPSPAIALQALATAHLAPETCLSQVACGKIRDDGAGPIPPAPRAVAPEASDQRPHAATSKISPAKAPSGPVRLRPAPTPASAPPAKAQRVEAPPVKISIGRIEIHAAAPAEAPRAASRPTAPAVSLEAYLAGRNGERSGRT